MDEFLDVAQLKAVADNILQKTVVLVNSPLFWLQFAVIAIVFFVARWFLTPLLRKGLLRLTHSFRHVPNFQAPIRAFSELTNTFAWLTLQWVAISIANKLHWPSGALTVIASLLTAWLLIRLATMLVANETLARVIAISAWTVAALKIFGLLEPVATYLDSWAINIGQVHVSILTFVKVTLYLWLSLWLANGLATLVERRLETASNVAPVMRVLGAKLTRILLITAAFLIAMSAVGIDLTAFAVFSGALGVGLGFGLQKIFSNLVSGVILLIDRSIKPGDVIAVGETYGWINYLGARYASVITRDGIEHLIPNEELITQRVENWSYSNELIRLRVPVGISYKSDPRKAMTLCIEAAKQADRVLQEPGPVCNLMGFGDSSVDLELRFWIKDPVNGRANVVSDVLLGVWDRFHEHGIEIPFPQRDLHVKSFPEHGDPQSLGDMIQEPPSQKDET